MRAKEFINETTTSGAVATVSAPLMPVLTRAPAKQVPHKYNNNSRKLKTNARR